MMGMRVLWFERDPHERLPVRQVALVRRRHGHDLAPTTCLPSPAGGGEATSTGWSGWGARRAVDADTPSERADREADRERLVACKL